MTVCPAGVRVRPISSSFHDATVSRLPFLSTVSLPECRYSFGCSTNTCGARQPPFRRCGHHSDNRWAGGGGGRTTWVILTALRRSTDSDAPARMGANARICVVLSSSVVRSASIASMPYAVAHRLVHTCCALAALQHARAEARASRRRPGGMGSRSRSQPGCAREASHLKLNP